MDSSEAVFGNEGLRAEETGATAQPPVLRREKLGTTTPDRRDTLSPFGMVG